MQRANDNPNQSLEEIKHTTTLLSQRVNQLERLLDQKSISEAKVESGTVYQRESRLSLSNGMMKSNWQVTSVTGSEDAITSIIAGTAISVSPVTGLGDVTVNNIGVTSLVAGTHITLDPASGIGDVTVNAAVGMDYDHIYIGGIEYTPGANTNDYDFIQIGADGSSSWIPAMISPMPTGYEIYNIRKNHIHITGATAGNI